MAAYAAQARCVDRSYPFFASQKSVRSGFNANSLAQTFALLYEGAGLEGASSHSAYFSPSWTAFQAERGRDFSVIVDGISN